jgi:hypothetical protein
MHDHRPVRCGITLATLATLTVSAAACGVGATSSATSASASGSDVVVTISPSSAEIEPSGEIAFGATVTGTADTSTTWTIQEGPVAGAVDHGKYKASTSEGVFHVVATSVADPTKSAVATVTSSKRRISVTPSASTVGACQTQSFSARLTGSGGSAVNWSVQEGGAGGSITSAGIYTAPSAAGTYHVVATSQADPTKTVAVPVTVATQVLSVTLSPATLAVAAGATRQLGATIVTSCGTFSAP